MPTPDPSRIVNYTTTVSVDKTLGEIKGILRAHGARSITEIYDDNHNLSGFEFVYETGWGPRPYQLPVRPEAVLRQMVERRNKGKREWDQHYVDAPWAGKTPRRGHEIPKPMIEQAERTAWRTVKDWLEAQMALMATRQISFEQIFLPYALVDGDKTMFDVYADSQKRLGSGAA